MASKEWGAAKPASVVNLHLDSKNPRLGRETTARAPREIVQYLFDHDKAMDVAESIATRGFFPNEPLLAVSEDGRLVVVEGNRRLAALKALREPGLLEGAAAKRVERLSRRMDLKAIARVPVVVAPNRKATDRLLAGRHIGTPVLAWQAENRASFILDKLAEGYDNDELKDDLGFTEADIQNARQTRAIADMARSIVLPDEVKAKLDNPRTNVLTTLARVFESSVGRDFLRVERDTEHGLRGRTTKTEFVKAFGKLVSDIALGKESSRTLNKNEDIERYFKKWKDEEKPKKKKATFVPSDIIVGKSVASSSKPAPTPPKRSRKPSNTVLPKDLHVRIKNDRLLDIRRELTQLKRDKFSNAGAVLLRVFFELSALDYLKRTGALAALIGELRSKNKLAYSVPTMRQLVPAIVKAAKANLTTSEANSVEKALRYDAAAPFSLSELHSFVHQSSELPNARDIQQFWMRTEPLFRLMLEQEPKAKS